jgi:uncharacterized protein YcbX
VNLVIAFVSLRTHHASNTSYSPQPTNNLTLQNQFTAFRKELKMHSHAIVSGISLFPVRSCAGADLMQASITPHGLVYDRQWRLVSATGEFLTQRECPKMALIRPSIAGSKLRLDYPGSEQLHVPICEMTAKSAITRVNENCSGVDQGEAVADWLFASLGTRARLLHLRDENNDVDFARPDMSPILVISEESLADLNSRLSQPVSMNRFRPNIIVRGVQPYEEDSWERVLIGDVLYEASKEPCGRCGMINIDQEKGEKAGKEPLKTLATYRRANGAVLFGKYMFAVSPGVVKINDTISRAAATRNLERT